MESVNFKCIIYLCLEKPEDIFRNKNNLKNGDIVYLKHIGKNADRIFVVKDIQLFNEVMRKIQDDCSKLIYYFNTVLQHAATIFCSYLPFDR